MKTDINLGSTKLGIEGWQSTTPKWAAVSSNYILLATVALFAVSAMVADWEWLIPDTKKVLIDAVIDSVEKTLVTIATALRFLGTNNSSHATEKGNE